MLDGLLIVDPGGIILAVNQAMEELSGYHREELVGQPCTIIRCHLFLDDLASGRCKECELFQTGLDPAPQMHHGEKGRHGAARLEKCRWSMKDDRQDGGRGGEFHRTQRGGGQGAGHLPAAPGTQLGGPGPPDMMQLFISHLQRELSQEDGFHGIIGRSP